MIELGKILLMLIGILVLSSLISTSSGIPFSMLIMPYFVVIVAIEVVAFFMLMRHVFRVKNIRFGQSLIAVLFSNFIFAVIGTFIFIKDISWIHIFAIFFLSVISEWIVYMLYFRKEKAHHIYLYLGSLGANLISCIPLSLLIMHK